jgi:hypothetical protein
VKKDERGKRKRGKRMRGEGGDRDNKERGKK